MRRKPETRRQETGIRLQEIQKQTFFTAGDAENTEKNKDIYWEKPRQKQTKFFTAGDAEGGAAERIKKLFYGKIHFQDIFTAGVAEGHREEQKPFYGKIHFQDICTAESAEGHREEQKTFYGEIHFQGISPQGPQTKPLVGSPRDKVPRAKRKGRLCATPTKGMG